MICSHFSIKEVTFPRKTVRPFVQLYLRLVMVLIMFLVDVSSVREFKNSILDLWIQHLQL